MKSTRKVKVDHVSLNCGATAIYQCMDTHEVTLGSGERMCGEDGAWSGSEPKCVGKIVNSLKGFLDEKIVYPIFIGFSISYLVLEILRFLTYVN